MMSPSDEKRIVAMVDSFTKTVARNFSRNLKRANSGAGNGYPRKERPASHQCTEQRGPQAAGGSLCPRIHQQRGAAYQL